MNVLPICLLASVFLLASAAHGQDESRSEGTLDAQPQFLETGKWWNLYFAKGNDPLARGTTSINAVKIVRLNETHGSWVQIAFPKKQKEHFSGRACFFVFLAPMAMLPDHQWRSA